MSDKATDEATRAGGMPGAADGPGMAADDAPSGSGVPAAAPRPMGRRLAALSVTALCCLALVLGALSWVEGHGGGDGEPATPSATPEPPEQAQGPGSSLASASVEAPASVPLSVALGGKQAAWDGEALSDAGGLVESVGDGALGVRLSLRAPGGEDGGEAQADGVISVSWGDGGPQGAQEGGGDADAPVAEDAVDGAARAGADAAGDAAGQAGIGDGAQGGAGADAAGGPDAQGGAEASPQGAEEGAPAPREALASPISLSATVTGGDGGETAITVTVDGAPASGELVVDAMSQTVSLRAADASGAVVSLSAVRDVPAEGDAPVASAQVPDTGGEPAPWDARALPVDEPAVTRVGVEVSLSLGEGAGPVSMSVGTRELTIRSGSASGVGKGAKLSAVRSVWLSDGTVGETGGEVSLRNGVRDYVASYAEIGRASDGTRDDAPEGTKVERAERDGKAQAGDDEPADGEAGEGDAGSPS